MGPELAGAEEPEEGLCVGKAYPLFDSASTSFIYERGCLCTMLPYRDAVELTPFALAGMPFEPSELRRSLDAADPLSPAALSVLVGVGRGTALVALPGSAGLSVSLRVRYVWLALRLFAFSAGKGSPDDEAGTVTALVTFGAAEVK
jgi:hypothetical protein